MSKDPSALNFLGPEFLSWLYFHLDEKGGELRFSEYSKQKISFEDSFRMCIGNRALLRPLAGESASVTVTGAAIDDSGEVLQAFRAGALVDSLSLEIHFSQTTYTFTVNAKDGSISQFKILQPFKNDPVEKDEDQELEDEANVIVRMSALDEAEMIVDALFQEFVGRRLHQAFVTTDLANMRRSVSEGLQSKLPPREQKRSTGESGLLEQPNISY